MSAIGTDPKNEPSVCPCEGETLDKLVQPAVLAVLAQGPLHGYKLAERLAEMPICGGQKPDVSGIYRFLKTMETNGYVRSSWDLAESGPARKSFRITAKGKRCLVRWIETLQRYRDQINALLKTARKSLA